jgi:hypothetical protein
MQRLLSKASRGMIFAGAVFVILSSTLFATAQETSPCAGDLVKFCGNVAPGGGRLLQCYEQLKNNMSRECVAWAEYMKANAAD